MNEEAKSLIQSAIICLLKAHEGILVAFESLEEDDADNEQRIMKETLFKIEAALSFINPDNTEKPDTSQLKLIE